MSSAPPVVIRILDAGFRPLPDSTQIENSYIF